MEFFDVKFTDLVLGFIAGNILWFSRQWLWERWAKKAHLDSITSNIEEEEKTRREIRKLREQIAEVGIWLGEVDPLTEEQMSQLKAIINHQDDEHLVG